MKRSTTRIFLPAHLTAAIVVGGFAYWLNTKFPAMNWSAPGLWGILAFCYLMIAGPMVAGATVRETAKYVTDGPYVPPAPPPLSQPRPYVPPTPSPPSQPRRPMPRALKIIGIAIAVLLALCVSLMAYFIFNPTPEMLVKAETRRVEAEIQLIETERNLKAAQQRLEAAKRR